MRVSACAGKYASRVLSIQGIATIAGKSARQIWTDARKGRFGNPIAGDGASRTRFYSAASVSRALGIPITAADVELAEANAKRGYSPWKSRASQNARRDAAWITSLKAHGFTNPEQYIPKRGRKTNVQSTESRRAH